jgi:hypothetical protein
MDKKGKEIYFDEDGGASHSFVEGMMIKTVTNPTWTIKTEDWGWFQRASEEVRKDSSSFWKDYDVWIAIVVTAGVTGIMWIINSIMEIKKFCGMKWDNAICVGNIFITP